MRLPRLILAACGLLAAYAVPAVAQQQLVGTERLYVVKSPDDIAGAGVTYTLSMDSTPTPLGVCQQTAKALAGYDCDYDLPASVFLSGPHVLQVVTVSAAGVWGGATPSLTVLGVSGSGPTLLRAPGAISVIAPPTPPPPSLTISPFPSASVTVASAPTAVTFQAPTLAGGVTPYNAVNCTPPSGASFPSGASSVTCSGSDAAAQIATTTGSVTVTVQAPPPTTTGWVLVGTVPTGGNEAYDLLIRTPCVTGVSDYWVAVRKIGVKRSLDCGATWSDLNAGFGIVDPAHFVDTGSAILLTGLCGSSDPCPSGQFGLWKWTGSAWAGVLNHTVNGIAKHGSEWLVAANTGGNYHVYAATDPTTTWTDVSGFVFAGVGGPLACASDGRCWMSGEGAGTWTSMDGFRADKTSVPCVPSCSGGSGMFSAAGLMLRAMAQDWRIWNGTTFPQQTNVGGYINGIYYTDSLFIGAVAVSPSGTVYVGSNHAKNGVYRTTNPGAGWTPYHEDSWTTVSGLGTVAVRVMSLRPEGADLLAVFRDGRIWRATVP